MTKAQRLKRIQKRMLSYKGQYPAIAQLTIKANVGLETIRSISQARANPKIETIEALERALDKLDKLESEIE